MWHLKNQGTSSDEEWDHFLSPWYTWFMHIYAVCRNVRVCLGQVQKAQAALRQILAVPPAGVVLFFPTKSSIAMVLLWLFECFFSDFRQISLKLDWYDGYPSSRPFLQNAYVPDLRFGLCSFFFGGWLDLMSARCCQILSFCMLLRERMTVYTVYICILYTSLLDCGCSIIWCVEHVVWLIYFQGIAAISGQPQGAELFDFMWFQDLSVQHNLQMWKQGNSFRWTIYKELKWMFGGLQFMEL